MSRLGVLVVAVVVCLSCFSGVATAADVLSRSDLDSDFCGSTVATGDVNGDGLSDVVMGCTDDEVDSSAYAGSIVVFVRNAGNTGFETGEVLTDPDVVSEDFCGNAVAVGDVNADGLGDIVMGCSEDTVGSAPRAGSAVVFVRNPGNTGFEAGVVLSKVGADSERCGISVAVGDINNDGLGDVVVGCYQSDHGPTAHAGSVLVFMRDGDHDDFDAGVELAKSTVAESDFCGVSVAVGDVNGDGLGDVVMGCSQADADLVVDAGSAVVFQRNVGNSGFDAGLELTRSDADTSDNCGTTIAVGDVNGDGLADVVMGCALDSVDSAENAGSAVVFVRDSVHEDFDAGLILTNSSLATDDFCGVSVAVGDVNSDGLGDVVVGCYEDDVSFAPRGGSALVFERNDGNTGFEVGRVLTKPNSFDDFCGVSVAVGDVNGDGLGDVIAGCYRDDVDSVADAGSVVVILSGANTTPPPTTTTSPTTTAPTTSTAPTTTTPTVAPVSLSFISAKLSKSTVTRARLKRLSISIATSVGSTVEVVISYCGKSKKKAKKCAKPKQVVSFTKKADSSVTKVSLKRYRKKLKRKGFYRLKLTATADGQAAVSKTLKLRVR